MIYLVTQQMVESPLYEVISVEKSLSLLKQISVVGVDTETQGFDPYKDELLLLQLGCYEFQIVIDCTTIDVSFYKEYLESDRTFIFWNAKFDLRFLYHKRIVINRVHDGYLAEKLLYLGYPAGVHGMGLKDAGERYCNIELDKSVRGKIHYEGLADEVIVYAANDVKYLENIMDAQYKELENKDLLDAIEYENRFVPVLAYIEYCGVKLDVPRWLKKMEKDKKVLEEKRGALNKWVEEHFPEDKRFTYREMQGDLFNGFDTSPKCIINWSSSKQVIVLLETLGFNLLVKDKETGLMKKSVESKVIEPQKDISDITPIYLDFKAAEKLTSTYGQNFLDQINVDGRIHTNFSQLMNTGRLSCGGKDKNTGAEYVNLQNLPADEETRACFIADSGNLWISADYQSQESRLIASIAEDPAMIDLFNNGCGDVHSLVAKMSYPDIIGDTPVEEIKKKFKHWRQEAKGVEFAINYGGNALTIANNKGISIEEATKIYNDYMKGFSGVKKYQDFCRKDVMQKGYILLNKISKHKCFIYDFKELKTLEDKFKSPNWSWEEYRVKKETNPFDQDVQDVKRYFKRKSSIEKDSINYRIQGTGALCFKLASIYFFNYLKEHNLLFKVKYCIPVRDELNIEVPEDMSEDLAKVLVEKMAKAGNFFCRKVELGADYTINKHWIH